MWLEELKFHVSDTTTFGYFGLTVVLDIRPGAVRVLKYLAVWKTSWATIERVNRSFSIC